MNKDTEQLILKDIFTRKNVKYVIPEYQRNYSWDEKEIIELLNDIKDCSVGNENYYVGTLVVYKTKQNHGEETVLETIDGQQRLTTFNILLCVLKNNEKITIPDMEKYGLNLKFACREISNKTLNELFEHGNTGNLDNFNKEIDRAYGIINKEIRSISEEKRTGFFEYLFNKVKILQVNVPEGTNLNRYFEIMNTRGEQLEKHEILKSWFLEKLSPKEKQVFNAVWEACSNMDKYVQAGFEPDIRKKLFTDELNDINFGGFDDIADNFAENHENSEEQSLEEIIMGNTLHENDKKEGGDDEYVSEKYHSVINFPHFLLQVLRVMTGDDVALDDKQLLEEFKSLLSDTVKIKEFAYNLLRARFLTDKFVIKRDNSGNKKIWSLKSIKNDIGSHVNTFEDEDIIMLLSMFHVSFPTQNYKHWFTAVLKYLINNEKSIKQDDFKSNYRQHLENVAKTFLFDNFLSKEKTENVYHTVIFNNNCTPKNSASDLDLRLLNRGTAVENFIFNYTDYLIWKNKMITDNDFEFTFRNSVEHFYPQQPVGNNPPLEEADENDDLYLDNFGNLCLISSSMNSRFNNDMPEAKAANYKNIEHKSLKLSLMMKLAEENGCWGINEIKEHSKEMKKLLLS